MLKLVVRSSGGSEIFDSVLRANMSSFTTTKPSSSASTLGDHWMKNAYSSSTLRTDRQTHRHRRRDRQTYTQTDRHWQTEWETYIQTDTTAPWFYINQLLTYNDVIIYLELTGRQPKNRQRETDKQIDRHRDRDRHKLTNTDIQESLTGFMLTN